MTKSYTLIVDIKSYWHPGTGSGRGSLFDSITYRNANGLPGLPGKHLKGLLRDAVFRAEKWGWFEKSDKNITDILFGPRGVSGQETWEGMLRISNAQLPDSTVTHLQSNKHLLSGLYRILSSTKINENGISDDQSLRAMEVIVPLKLEAKIKINAHSAAENQNIWPQLFEDSVQKSLSLVRAVGGKRSRGLGRAELTLDTLEDTAQ